MPSDGVIRTSSIGWSGINATSAGTSTRLASPVAELTIQPTCVPCNVSSKNPEMSRLRVADDITQLVGETPMLQLKRLVPAGSADVFAKLEYLNPGGSVKDRAAIGIIRRAEQEGKLSPAARLLRPRRETPALGWL